MVRSKTHTQFTALNRFFLYLSLFGSMPMLQASFLPVIGPYFMSEEQKELKKVQDSLATGSDKSTMFWNALREGKLVTINYLLDHGIDINDNVGEFGTQAIHIAAYTLHLEVVDHLLSQGMDVNVVDVYGRTALHIAIECGPVAMAKHLIDKGAVVKSNLLIVDWLIEKGSIPNASYDEYKALYLAVERGQVEMVKHLIANEGGEKAIEKIAPILLNLAIIGRNVAVLDYLLSLDIDVNAPDAGNNTVLHNAVLVGAKEMVQEVIRHQGIQFDCKDSNGDTPKELANRLGYYEIESILQQATYR